MKKKVLSGIFALALLATAGYGVSKSMKSDAGLSDLALANVEALAQNESGGGGTICSTYTLEEESFTMYEYCTETESWGYVIVSTMLSRACNDGWLTWCYPGTIVNYYNFCGEFIRSQDQTRQSTCGSGG